jgi:hypothetical protein
MAKTYLEASEVKTLEKAATNLQDRVESYPRTITVMRFKADGSAVPHFSSATAPNSLGATAIRACLSESVVK